MVLKSLMLRIIKIKIWENELMASYLEEHNIHNQNRSKSLKMKIIIVIEN
jgi:hypothetical protein